MLAQVPRFRHHWERRASLRLRTGDRDVLAEYETRERLHGGTLGDMEAEVITAWHRPVTGVRPWRWWPTAPTPSPNSTG